MLSAVDSTRLRVSGLTRWGAENVRDTVETWTPDARATSRIVAGTWLSSRLSRSAATRRSGRGCLGAGLGCGPVSGRVSWVTASGAANYANGCAAVNAPGFDSGHGIDPTSGSCA